MVYNLGQFRDWMFSAAAGERCLYHSGQMLADQDGRPDLKHLGRYVVLMTDLGAVRIIQKRADENLYQYFASRTDMPARNLPRSVALGDVSVATYKVLSAIHMRERRVSVKKAIRDAITITEEEAAEILDRMIAAGIVNPGTPRGRGPYLERIGLEALK